MNKLFIPLVVQNRYKPDGWLGRILGTTQYFDVSNTDNFEEMLIGLKKELKEMLNVSLSKESSTIGNFSR